ncbi:set and mynd domain protein [Niveomyces insectorum RCEF 264]|uniref:Set and mynd domain protein n=1 Tax=Niveomyces insectorum RCEF 264 TaxID=1081102 RepID=A0A167TUN0_9HYPO|nr:set and mynd domain protein [Niveomyces insectorum RCEF 264]
MAAVPPGVEIRGERAPEPSPPEATTTASSSSASSTAARQSSNRRGRGLFATRDFQPGEAIAVFGTPLQVLPFSRDARQTCNYCLDPRRQPVKACTGCRAVAYCSSRCQKAHWTLVHKVECAVLRTALTTAAKEVEAARQAQAAQKTAPDAGDAPAVAPPPPVTVPTPVRALVQILLLWSKLRGTVDRLEGNVAAFRQNKPLWDDFTVQAVAACSFVGWSTKTDVQTALEVLCKIHTNSFDRSDSDLGHSGTFLDVTLAMVNHSCVPNAVVVFTGRKAYLRAEQPVQAGAEITISYIDYTKPRAARQRGLALYHFTCDCPRCAGDLDVYAVCRASPLLSLNAALSFVPDTNALRNPPVDAARLSSTRIDEMYAACDPERPVAAADRLASLRRQWALCRPLVAARRWAVEPLAHIFQQAIVYYSEQNNFAHALAVECFVALHCDPYKYVAPFAQWRLKGLLLIAKTVTNTNLPAAQPPPSAPPALASPSSAAIHPGIDALLARLADGALYEAILLMVLRYGPLGHSDEWELLDTARDMLQDVQSVPGRESLSAALQRWIQQPSEPEAAAFFHQHILEPVDYLASLALDILKGDLEDQSIADKVD